MLSMLLAQAVAAADPIAEYGKLGVGLASFAALLRFLWWMANELKASRHDFLIALDRRDEHNSTQLQLLREHNERQVSRLHEDIDTLGQEVRQHVNGRGR